MVGRLDIKFQNVNTDVLESQFHIFIKVSIKWNKIMNQILTLKFPVPFFNCQSLSSFYSCQKWMVHIKNLIKNMLLFSHLIQKSKFRNHGWGFCYLFFAIFKSNFKCQIIVNKKNPDSFRDLLHWSLALDGTKSVILECSKWWWPKTSYLIDSFAKVESRFFYLL